MVLRMRHPVAFLAKAAGPCIMQPLHSLRASLGWLFAAVFLPLLLAGAAFLAHRWYAERDQAFTRIQDQARILRDAVDRELALDLAVLSTLSAAREIDREDWAGFHQVAKQASEVRPGSWFALMDREGRNLVNTHRPFGVPLPNYRELLSKPTEVEWEGRKLPLADYDLFGGPLQDGRPRFSGLIYGSVSGRPTYGSTVAVMREGRPVYTLGLVYDADFFVKLLQARSGRDGLLFALVDHKGLILARNRKPEQFVGHPTVPQFRNPASLPEEGLGEGATVDGVDAFYAFVRSRLDGSLIVVGIPKAELLAPVQHALGLSAAIVLAIGLLAGLFGIRLWRRLAIPLGMLAKQARTLGESHPDMPPAEIREVEALRQALQQAAHNERIRRQAEREREEAREALGVANDRLVEAARRKDEFLAMLSHELRNPLAAIANVGAVLQRGDTAPPQARALHEILQRQTRQLARMVDDLLDVARITSGKVHVRREPVRLDQVVQRAALDARSNMEARAHRFSVSAPEAMVVLGDEARLTQAVANLLDNAAKYTEAGGSVELSLRREDGAAVIRVRDTGVGIDPALLPHLFELFTQGERTLDRSQGGLGIGLTVVRKLVELHGGTVEVSSPGRGQGSEFVVRLPAVHAGQPERSPPSSAPSTAPRSILVVEDNRDTADSLAMLLGMEGHEVVVAHDGDEGLRKAEALRPDAILLDIGLPGISGTEVCRSIRARPWGGEPVIVALTGWGQEQDHQRSREAGFDAHLVKPVDHAEVFALLARHGAGAPRADEPSLDQARARE